MAKKTLRKVCALTAMSLTVLMMVGSVGASYASSVEDLLVDVLNTAIKEAAKSSPQRKSEPAPKKAKSSAKKTEPAEISSAPSSSGEEKHLFISSSLTPPKSDVIGKSLLDLAKRIMANNKYAFETKMTQKDRELYEMGEEIPTISQIIWNRVWAKDKTIVVGEARKDKKFRVRLFMTRDPQITFVNGLRVGDDIHVLEQFFGSPLERQFYFPEGITWLSIGNTGEFIHIFYKDDKITELRWFNLMDPTAKKTDNFVKQTAQRMGFPSSFSMTPDEFGDVLEEDNKYYRDYPNRR